MTTDELAERLFEEHMADSVLIILTRSDRKSGTTEKWVSAIGNTYACTGSAQEWLDECDAISRNVSIDRTLGGESDATP